MINKDSFYLRLGNNKVNIKDYGPAYIMYATGLHETKDFQDKKVFLEKMMECALVLETQNGGVLPSEFFGHLIVGYKDIHFNVIAEKLKVAQNLSNKGKETCLSEINLDLYRT